MRSSTLIASLAAFIILGVNGYTFADFPQQPGNQNLNWQGNQTPNFRNDAGWNNTTNNNSNNSSNYFSKEEPSTNSSHMFDDKEYGQTNINNAPATSGSSATQGYYYNQPAPSQPSPTAPVQQQTLTPRPGNGSAPDSLVQNRIESALKNNQLRKNYENVTVRVYQGSVTLSGRVDNEQDRQEVEARVRSIPGISNLNDQIQVYSIAASSSSNAKRNYNQIADAATTDVKPAVSTVSDQDLQKDVNAALKSHADGKSFDLIITSVSSGTVTVSGLVKDELERQEIINRIKKVKGVVKIDDRLQTAPIKSGFNY